jgi:hypothetical protein
MSNWVWESKGFDGNDVKILNNLKIICWGRGIVSIRKHPQSGFDISIWQEQGAKIYIGNFWAQRPYCNFEFNTPFVLKIEDICKAFLNPFG